MFRRREDSLFDNELTDTTSEQETATVIKTPTAAPAAPIAAAAQAPAQQPAASASQASPISRPAAPAAPASATGFRPAQTPAVEIPRARLPEAPKPPLPSSLNISANRPAGTGGRILTVGHDILLKGEIATCDRLVIQDKVEATLNDVHTMELAEIGSFKGSANVVEAEISGNFEGDLVVTGRLVIYASGKVHGRVTYGEIEIERGGQLSGEITASDTSHSSAKSRQKEAA